MKKHILIVYGGSFRNDSPRMRRAEAERLVASLGLKKPPLVRRVLAWVRRKWNA